MVKPSLFIALVVFLESACAASKSTTHAFHLFHAVGLDLVNGRLLLSFSLCALVVAFCCSAL
jgi:hypothetical protein